MPHDKSSKPISLRRDGHDHSRCMQHGLMEFQYLKLDLRRLKAIYEENLHSQENDEQPFIRDLIGSIMLRLGEVASLQGMPEIQTALQNAAHTMRHPEILEVLQSLQERVNRPLAIADIPRELEKLKEAPPNVLAAIGKELGRLNDDLAVVSFQTLSHEVQASKVFDWLQEHDQASNN